MTTANSQSASFLKKTLKQAGLSDDFGDALRAMALMVRNHEHLERLLSDTEPDMRQATYDALRPNLRFQAKPLDVYIADAKHRAERERLPLLGPNGQLIPFTPAQDRNSLERHTENLMAAEMAKRIFTVTCSKCTAQEQFFAVGGETNVDVILKARRAGWIYDPQTEKEVCPDCPTSLRTIN